MTLYKDFYGRPCRTSLCGQVEERRVIETSMVQETIEQVEMLKALLKEAHNRPKSYAYKLSKDLEFQVGDLVYMKMMTFQGGSKTQKIKKKVSAHTEASRDYASVSKEVQGMITMLVRVVGRETRFNRRPGRSRPR